MADFYTYSFNPLYRVLTGQENMAGVVDWAVQCDSCIFYTFLCGRHLWQMHTVYILYYFMWQTFVADIWCTFYTTLCGRHLWQIHTVYILYNFVAEICDRCIRCTFYTTLWQRFVTDAYGVQCTIRWPM